MTRYVAFLGAINVGGRTVKMDRLRAIFEEMGFVDVATFIASGNVIFDSSEQDARTLEDQIEQHLQATLGYAVDTFLRSTSELAAIAAYEPFPKAKPDAAGTTLYISFLHDRYGSWYLDHLRDRYDGDARLALAAYHAGQGNVYVPGADGTLYAFGFAIEK